MVRTQIYLTQHQHDMLTAIAKATGRKQSELIREAVDRMLEADAVERRQSILREAAGIWKDRSDLPDFERLRKEFDRR